MRALREIDVRRFLRPLAIAFSIFAVVLIVSALIYSAVFGPQEQKDTIRREFVVSPEDTLPAIAYRLEEEGLVRAGWAFQIAYVLSRNEDSVRAGGYLLAPSMDAWALAKTFGNAPYLAWVQVPTGIRKEQLAHILETQLSWTKAQTEAWLSSTEIASSTLSEGFYFSDVYLIPSDQAPEQITARFLSRFNEAVAPYQLEAKEKDIAWQDVLTLASLIERESAKNDKRLVSGILWNRLEKGMLLQVDATLQYAIGNAEDGWWPLPTSSDKYVESPFNTYQHTGLPPAPIATPSLASIEAAINPEQTNCLYYLHDNDGRIHCSTTYKAHVANVHRYLK